MHLKHSLRQIEPDGDNLRHDRSPLWIVADPPWHSDAVGGAVTASEPFHSINGVAPLTLLQRQPEQIAWSPPSSNGIARCLGRSVQRQEEERTADEGYDDQGGVGKELFQLHGPSTTGQLRFRNPHIYVDRITSMCKSQHQLRSTGQGCKKVANLPSALL
jgi:hypothetical protein